MTAVVPLAINPMLQGITGGTPATPDRQSTRQAKAWAQGQEFEAAFLNSMFQHMYTGVGGEGPFGNSTGVGVWRSFLTEQYAKSFVKAGGVGIAAHVYQSLLAHQEARAR